MEVSISIETFDEKRAHALKCHFKISDYKFSLCLFINIFLLLIG